MRSAADTECADVSCRELSQFDTQRASARSCLASASVACRARLRAAIVAGDGYGAGDGGGSAVETIVAVAVEVAVAVVGGGSCGRRAEECAA